MLSLKRKKNKDEEEEIEDASKKDEKPKRRRKKKEEEKKPWGKKERYIVFGVLLASIGTSAFLALSARSWKLPGLPRISLPKEMFEKTYVFEGDIPKRDTSKIISDFNNMTREASGIYGFYAINLNTDESYGVEIDEEFQAASLIKLPVMAMMYTKDEEGVIDLDDTYTLRNEDKVGGSGSIVYQEAGTKYSYRELVEYMGQQSDNTAFTASVNLLGGEDEVQKYIDEIGMEHTSIEENETTIRDIGNFYKKLWERTLVNRSSRDEILKYLTDTIYENWIAAGIADVRVAHKFGREVHVTNDAGIVFADDPYVLVIMSKGVLESESDKLIPQLANLIHQFETNSVE